MPLRALCHVDVALGRPGPLGIFSAGDLRDSTTVSLSCF
jgi:hypothetical protein